VLISFAWFAAFGLLVNTINQLSGCGGIWNWNFLHRRNDVCGRWKAAEAFAFLSAIIWLVSALVVCAIASQYKPPRINVNNFPGYLVHFPQARLHRGNHPSSSLGSQPWRRCRLIHLTVLKTNYLITRCNTLQLSSGLTRTIDAALNNTYDLRSFHGIYF
jgi:hypothetical protein